MRRLLCRMFGHKLRLRQVRVGYEPHRLSARLSKPEAYCARCRFVYDDRVSELLALVTMAGR